MKKIATLFLIFMLYGFPIFSQASWEIKPSPVSEDLVSVCFYDELHGCIVSTQGTILITSDGGDNWTTHSYSQYHFRSVHFPGPGFGCIVGWHVAQSDSSLILMTLDDGATWTEAGHPKVNRLNDVYFETTTMGWAVGAYDNLNLNCCMYTDNGGYSWTMQDMILVSEAELFGVHFRDLQTGVVCGADGAFLHTNNGGATGWSLNISMPLVNLNAVWNHGSQHGCAVGDEGTILYTINDWYQHIEQTSGTIENLNDVCAEPATNKLWIVGNSGTILYSSSYLLGWSIQASGTTENLQSIWMLGETSGWAVGDNGTILRYAAGTAVADHWTGPEITVTPNPSDGLVRIKLDRKELIDRIEVIDMLGQLNQVYLPTETRVVYSIDLSELQRGIYFLKLYSKQKYIIKRQIINP